MNYAVGQKVRHKKTGEVFDFGYIGDTGLAIVYAEGERGMQSSCGFPVADLEPVDNVLEALESRSQTSNTTQETNEPPVPSRIGGNRPDGYEVARWPEFIAFAKRIGLSLDLPWTAVEIRVAINDVVRINQEYLADDIDQQHRKHAWETTTVHNKEFRTFQPPSLKESNMIVYKQRNLRVNGEDILESLSSPNGSTDSKDQQVQWSNGKKRAQSRAETVEDARRSVIQAWGLPIDAAFEIKDVTEPTTEGERTAL